MKNIFTLVIVAFSVVCSAQTTYMPDDIFENTVEGMGLGDGILGNDLVDSAAISQANALILSNLPISDYTGLEGFKSLKEFYVGNAINNGLINISIDISSFSDSLEIFEATGNPLLFCIQVNDTTAANDSVNSGSWVIDAHASFSTDCSTAFGCLDPVACNWAPTHSIDTISGFLYPCNYDVTNNVVVDTCSSFTWPADNLFAAETWNTPTTPGVSTFTQTRVYTAVNGCDSTVNLSLTLRHATVSVTDTTVCNLILWNGVVHDSSGTYEWFSTNANGCDSTAVLNLTVNFSNTGSSIDTSCDTYIWDGSLYNSSGLYTKTYTNIAGCDSVHTLHLTINNSNTGSSSVTSCNTYTWEGQTVTSSDTLTHTYINGNGVGCDSVHTLIVNITNWSSSYTPVTSCDWYFWSVTGLTYNISQLVIDSNINAQGCLNIDSLDLVINNSTSTYNSLTPCDSYIWSVSGDTIYNDGLYINVSTNGANCTHTDSLQLTFIHSTSSTITLEKCDTLTIGGATYDTTGIYFYQIPNAAGCDSNITLHLTINYTDTSWNGQNTFNTVADSACDYYEWNNVTYTTSLSGPTGLGVGNHLLEYNTVTNPGCDSTAYQNLFLGANYSDTNDLLVCTDYYWINIYNDTLGIFLQAGDTIAVVEYINQQGCDSIHVLDLTYNQPTIPSNAPADTFACEFYVDQGGNIFNNTVIGQSIVVGTNQFGCDSLAFYNVFVVPENRVDTFATACDDFTWDRTGLTYTNSTIDSVVFPIYSYFNGGLDSILCDSTIYLNLTINDSYIINESPGSGSVSYCDSYFWPVNGTTYNSSTVDTVNFLTINGCDSIRILNLTLSNSTSTSFSDEGCDNEEYLWITNNNDTILLDSTGLYTHISTNNVGCTHTDSIFFTLTQSFSDSLTPETPPAVCDSFFWDVGNSGFGVTYFTGGLKASYFTNPSNGCDSVHWLNLDMEYTQSYSTSIDSCDSYTWIDGVNYNTSGTYTYLQYTPNAACTITNTLNLTIRNSTTGFSTDTVCEPFIWWGDTLDVDTIITKVLTNSVGCDSTHTLDLTVAGPTSTLTSATSCDSYTWNGVLYTTSGFKAHISTNSFGCVHTDSLDLTIITTVNTHIYDTACHTYTWPLASQNFDSTNVYPYIEVNACGGYDTTFLHLFIFERVYGSGADTACNSYEWLGNTYDSTGSYLDTLVSSVGCDSVATLNLVVYYNDSSYTTLHNVYCDTLFIESDTLTTDGIHYVLADQPTINGCDSIIVVDLDLDYTVYNTNSITVCDTFYWYADTIVTSGQHSHIYVGGAWTGCDSVVVLNVTMAYSSDTIDVQSHCNVYTWIDGITYTSSNNTATYSYITPAGCDSTIHLSLTINYTDTASSTIDTLCVPFAWGNTVITSPGIYTETFMNLGGCDSVHTVTISNILNNTEGVSSDTACDTYSWEGMIYDTTGSYTQVFTNSIGCDSTHTLNLFVKYSVTGSSLDTVCDHLIWGNDTLTSSGIYTQTFTSSLDCDSVHTLDLHVKSNTGSTDIHESCGPFMWQLDSVTYNTSNNSAFVIYNAINGCDSIVTLDLTVNDKPEVVASQISGTINWEAIITGGTPAYIITWTDPQGFFSNVSPLVPTISGWFSVYVEDANGCYSDIDSFEVNLSTVVDVKDISELSIYPNPASDYITIEFTATKKEDYTVRIISTNGLEVYKDELIQLNGYYKSNIDLSTYAKGNYLIEISSKESKVFSKILLQ